MTSLIDYGTDVEDAIAELVCLIEDVGIADTYPARWLAIALLAGDPGIDDLAGGSDSHDRLVRRAAELRREIGGDVRLRVAGSRFDTAHHVAASATAGSARPGTTRSDRIDAIVTHRFAGIPIFLGLMWGVFALTTDVAGALLERVDQLIGGPVSDAVGTVVDIVGLGDTWIRSLVVDGAIAGVGAVLVFVPVLVCLYVALAILEDSGYMARAAFVMDRFMRSIGLQGKSFLPMLVGFGCTVPAVYATRTIDNERDRIVTTLLTPFMSCGARLPVYVLIGAVFFPNHAGTVTFGLYLLGIVVALVLGLIARNTILPSRGGGPTVMEMPKYRMPTVGTIASHTWTRTRAFLTDAGTVIFTTMLVVWLLMAIPVGGSGGFSDIPVEESAFATIARTAAPVLEPAGFGTWEAAGSLMSGLVAKEVVVGTMAQVYGADSDGEVFDEAIRSGFEESSDGHGSLAALAFLVFVLIYTPCVAASAAIRQEIGARWMWGSMIGQTLLAWLMAVAVFQIGRLLFG